jgi:RNA-directed DNA polymerase
MNDTQRSSNVLTKQLRIAQLARERPSECFTALNHYLDLEWLQEAYQRVRGDSAPGCDGQTVLDYGRDLEKNLCCLLDRAKSGSYFAPPVLRVYIPKDDGKETRPIGMPTVEDKILQRAGVMLLEPIYEQDFLSCSHGFRPGHSAHEALASLWSQAMYIRVRWIVEVDIRKFFDTLKHGYLMDILRQRVRDGVILRLIGKWLKAGVLEAGQVSYPEEGTPQGGIISPLLSNIYLHTVLDQWYQEQVKPCLKGRSFLVRYADDFVMGFELQADADKVFRVLFKRFEKFGLSLHPEKTRRVPFGRPDDPGAGRAGGTKPGTFDFLGFTHYWRKSWKGRWVLARKTAHKRLSRALRRISQWCRKSRDKPLREQVETLGRKFQGHFGYYGITGNLDGLVQFREAAIGIWRKWLDRRTGDRGSMPWERMKRLLDCWYLPEARVVHSIYAAKP